MVVLDHASRSASWAIQHVLENKNISGPVNLTSPNPVTNQEFTSALARAFVAELQLWIWH
jgi:NAD dependent epimerase/dehydratase family enzyme